MALTAKKSLETPRAGLPAPMPGPALRMVPGPWSIERAVFAPDELGWLAEEAQRHRDLLGLVTSNANVVDDPHLACEPFRRLVLHPRLLHRAVGVLRSPIAIARALTTTSITAPRLALASDEVAMIVALESSADVRRGDVVIAQGREALPLHLERSFIAVYRADPSSQLAAENDDCLWPSPWVVAG